MSKLMRPARLLLCCLLIPTLTACASKIPVSPPSSSEIVRETAADAGALYCSALRPEPIPTSATVEWINHAARAAERWLTMCKES